MRVRKVLLRARQFARNCDNVQAYTKVLNEHNAAALHKLAEMRPLAPGLKAADRRASQCTRDVMVPAWRERRRDAHENPAEGAEKGPPPPPLCAAHSLMHRSTFALHRGELHHALEGQAAWRAYASVPLSIASSKTPHCGDLCA